jgi:hypothetical protein
MIIVLAIRIVQFACLAALVVLSVWKYLVRREHIKWQREMSVKMFNAMHEEKSIGKP